MSSSRTPLIHSYAWLVVWVLGDIAGSFEEAVTGALGSPAATLSYVVIGILLGLLWYLLYPRAFSERLRAIGRVLLALVAFVAVLGVLVMISSTWDSGASMGFGVRWPTPNDYSGVGVLAGLLLAERRLAVLGGGGRSQGAVTRGLRAR